MRVIVEFCNDVDVVDCPEIVVNNLDTYKVMFTDWFYNKNNNHGYWNYINGKQRLRSFRSEVFIDWLNNYILVSHKEKAKVLIQGVDLDGLMLKVVHPNDIYEEMYSKIRDYRRWLMATNPEGVSREHEYRLKYGERKHLVYAQKDWLNEGILKDRTDKAYVFDNDPDFDETKEYPRIYF